MKPGDYVEFLSDRQTEKGPSMGRVVSISNDRVTIRHSDCTEDFKRCNKILHTGTGYLHGDNDDTPYDVDGCVYCGRCHQSLDKTRG